MRHLRNDILKQVGRQFAIEKYGMVSSIVERLKAMVNADRGLKKTIENLTGSILMSKMKT